MTTTYPSIDAALSRGIYFAGRGKGQNGEEAGLTPLKTEDLEGKPGVIQGALGLLSPEIADLFDSAGVEDPEARGGKYNAVIYDIDAVGKDGKQNKAQLGVTTFRDGYNLWLVDVSSGMCVRS